ncbi:TetR-like C-terminal domain-containing protein [Dactylosporangium vinaceum]|uniref:TetR-like C-terminal domain-containing protein n=1 Tax=Dactylosporangium vinaceum TaxID=53362 RepID=UPI001CA97811|nr:TetR-like C-terminal domain-containing protein [Dactylosporangium vinaceum]
MDAALRVVDAGGPAALTLAAVAAECGVATPSLYKHVAGLPELRGLLTVRIYEELTTAVIDAVIGRSGDDALEAVMLAYHGYAIGHPHRYSLAPQRPDVTDPAAAAAASRILDVLFAVFKAYDLTDEQIVHATRVLRAAMHGFAVLHGAFQMVEDVRTTQRILIETMKSIRVAAKIAS